MVPGRPSGGYRGVPPARGPDEGRRARREGTPATIGPVAPPERYAVLAPLPDAGPFRRVLAIERGAVPRAVVVYLSPPELPDDPVRLPALIRDAEAAARYRHPLSVSVMGLESVGDGPAVVESYRPGVALREALDAAGRMPAPVAARVALDLCEAVAALHAFDAGDGRPLVHGAIAPDRVWMGDQGQAELCGLGTGGGKDPTDDVRGVADVLAWCLSGEKPGERFDAPGVPPSIASVVTRYRSPASAVLGPAALSEAIAAGVKPAPATREEVAAWVSSALPPGKGARAERSRLIEEALGPEARFGGAAAGSRGKVAQPKEEPGPAPAPEPTEPTEEVGADQIFDQAALSAKTMPMMRAITDEEVAAARARSGISSLPDPDVHVEPTPIAVSADAARTFAAPRPAEPPARAILVAVGLVFGAIGFGGGFALSRAGDPPAPATPPPAPPAAVPASTYPPPLPAPSPEPSRPARAEPAASKKARKEARSAPAGSADPAPAGAPGMLTVTAPDGAEVRVDGKLLGKGSLKREVPPGKHRIEIRLGEARTTEGFEMEAGGTYAYEVTPR